MNRNGGTLQMKKNREVILVAVAAISLIGAACTKKVAIGPSPPPVPAATAPSTPARAAMPVRQNPMPTQTATAAAPRYPNAATRARIDELLARIEDAYFDYNKHTLRPDAIAALQADSTELRDILKDFPDYKLTIEGNCDERGSAEYNLALGDARAKSAKDYLVQVGIPDGQLSIISYGKDRPVCQEHDETCWQKNRRIHIVAMTASR
jgi:peptidoglycan-associated lipoprotein